MSNPLAKIGHVFKKIGMFVSAAFIAIFGEQTAKDFAGAAVQMLKTNAGKLALEAVQDIAIHSDPAASDQQKHDAAFNKVADDAKKAGLELGHSLINMLIELAVNSVKGHFGEGKAA